MIEKLTEKEKEILELLSQGFTNKEISTKLFIQLSTVKTHIHNIYDKYGINGPNTRIKVALIYKGNKNDNQ